MAKASTPEAEARRREKIAEAARRRYSRPGVREEHSRRMKEVYSDPEVRERLSQSHMGHEVTDETKAKISAAIREKWFDPDFVRKYAVAKKQGIVRARRQRVVETDRDDG